MMVKLRWEAEGRCQKTNDMIQGDLRTDKEKLAEAMVTNPDSNVTDLSKMKATQFLHLQGDLRT